MNKPLLSILVPITPDRLHHLPELFRSIGWGWFQLDLKYLQAPNWNVCFTQPTDFGGQPKYGVILMCDNREMTIGEKRKLLYKKANGLFSIQVDSDDLLAPNAIQLILEAIKSNPEIPCITFREKCMMNGEYKSSNHSIRYEKWQDNFDGYDYVRCPFYKDVIRTDIAKSVPFPHIRYNEDEQWSMAIKPLLTEEIHIDEELYHYIYEPKDTHQERYGIV